MKTLIACLVIVVPVVLLISYIDDRQRLREEIDAAERGAIAQNMNVDYVTIEHSVKRKHAQDSWWSTVLQD